MPKEQQAVVVGLSDQELNFIVKRGWRIFYSWTNAVQRQEHAVLDAMKASAREFLQNRNDRRSTDEALVEDYARAAIAFHARTKLRKQKVKQPLPTRNQVADYVERKMEELVARNFTPEAAFRKACNAAKRHFHLPDPPIDVRAKVEQVFARRRTAELRRRKSDKGDPIPF